MQSILLRGDHPRLLLVIAFFLRNWYSGTPPYAVSPVEGIRRRVGAGVAVSFMTGNDLDAAEKAAKAADVAVVVIGNHPTCNAGWAKYAKLRLSSKSMGSDGSVKVSVAVTNTGSRAGDEVVQMYVQHLGSKVERPIRELKGFERVSLAPKETKVVEMQLPASARGYWNEAQHGVVEEEEPVKILVGGSSDNVRTEGVVGVMR